MCIRDRKKRRRSVLPILTSVISAAALTLLAVKFLSPGNEDPDYPPSTPRTIVQQQVLPKEPEQTPQESRHTREQPQPRKAPTKANAKPSVANTTPGVANANTAEKEGKQSPAPFGPRRGVEPPRFSPEKDPDVRTESQHVTLDLDQEITSQVIPVANKDLKVEVKIVRLLAQYTTRIEPPDGSLNQNDSVNIRFFNFDDIRIRCELTNGRMTFKPQVRAVGQEWNALTKQSITRIRDAFVAENADLEAQILRIRNTRVPRQAYNAAVAERRRLEQLQRDVQDDIRAADTVRNVVLALNGRAQVVYEVTTSKP